MLELTSISFVFIPLIVLLIGLAYSRLQKPKIPSNVPSLTKSIWSEIKMSLNIGMKHPKGMH